MTGHRSLRSISKQDLLQLFSAIDHDLKKMSRSMTVTVLGGAAIILMGFRDRSTLDIDVTVGPEVELFQSLCSAHGVPVDVITISSTVDFTNAANVAVFQGEKLVVHSITSDDLIKLKLERFRKQDPEDIYAILEKTGMNYERFREIVQDMIPDFIGNLRELVLSAQIVVERIYPGKTEDFKKIGSS